MLPVEYIGKLSTEDLTRWRVISANKELVDIPHPGLSVNEARGFIMDFYRFIGEIIEDYGIPPTVAFEVTVSDGSILKMVDN